MEHDAGRSTTSGMATVLSKTVASCTISFQGFRDYPQLHAALTKHALKLAGISIKFTPMVNVLARHDILSRLPRVLAPSTYSQQCSGRLGDFLRSSADVEIYAALFCHNDVDFATSQIAADLLAPDSRSVRHSPSEFDSSTLAKTSPSRGASDLRDRMSLFGSLSVGENEDGSTVSPRGVEAMDPSAYLRTKFGAGPYGPYLRSLRVMLKTFDETPDYAALSRLLQPLSTGELTSIATLVAYELPPPKWSASTRSSLVVAALARVLASIFQAAQQLSTEAARVAADGGGGGGGFGHGGAAEEPSPSLSDPDPDR